MVRVVYGLLQFKLEHCYSGVGSSHALRGPQIQVVGMALISGVAKGGPSRARPNQSSVVPYQMMLNYLPLYTLNTCTYR